MWGWKHCLHRLGYLQRKKKEKKRKRLGIFPSPAISSHPSLENDPALLERVTFHIKKREPYTMTQLPKPQVTVSLWTLPIATLDPGAMGISLLQARTLAHLSCIFSPSACSVRLSCQPKEWIWASVLQIGGITL